MTVTRVAYTLAGGPRLQHIRPIAKSSTAYTYDTPSPLLYNKQAQDAISTIK